MKWELCVLISEMGFLSVSQRKPKHRHYREKKILTQLLWVLSSSGE